VRVTPLSKRDIEICRRLKSARERIGATQDVCAREIGVKKSTLANLELLRAPVNCEVALRFCRQMIISEEWLATGRFEATHAAALKETHLKNTKDWKTLDAEFFFRHCVDLLSEPIVRRLPTGISFGTAFDLHLAPHFGQLISEAIYFPRIVFNDVDSVDLFINFFSVLQRAWIILLQNEALRLKKNPNMAMRDFLRKMFETNMHIFTRCMGFEKNNPPLNQLEWLKESLSVSGKKIGFLHSSMPARAESQFDFIHN
jgi:DNA-binding XRE family transcriptional regulator